MLIDRLTIFMVQVNYASGARSESLFSRQSRLLTFVVSQFIQRRCTLSLWYRRNSSLNLINKFQTLTEDFFILILLLENKESFRETRSNARVFHLEDDGKFEGKSRISGVVSLDPLCFFWEEIKGRNRLLAALFIGCPISPRLLNREICQRISFFSSPWICSFYKNWCVFLVLLRSIFSLHIREVSMWVAR